MNRPTILDSDLSNLDTLSKDEAASAIRLLCSYVRQLESDQSSSSINRQNQSTSPNAAAVGSVAEERLRQQQIEASRRENVLVMRLTTKEQEVQEYVNRLEEMRLHSASTSRTVLLDPAINVVFQRMKSELRGAREEVDQTRQELEAWKFTPDSATGKRLMARCRQLFQENEEMGQKCNSGRVAKLEGDLSMARSMCEDFRHNQSEVDDYLLESETQMEQMAAVIAGFQSRLKEAQDENKKLRILAGLSLDATLDDGLNEEKIQAAMDTEEPKPLGERHPIDAFMENEEDVSNEIDPQEEKGISPRDYEGHDISMEGDILKDTTEIAQD